MSFFRLWWIQRRQYYLFIVAGQQWLQLATQSFGLIKYYCVLRHHIYCFLGGGFIGLDAAKHWTRPVNFNCFPVKLFRALLYDLRQQQKLLEEQADA